MTREEVIAALGAPQQIERVENGELWIYPEREFVYLERGRAVKAWRWTPFSDSAGAGSCGFESGTSPCE